jgi:hypothetical protein
MMIQCDICHKWISYSYDDPEDDLDQYGFETPVEVDAPEGSIRGQEQFACFECITTMIWHRLERRHPRKKASHV